MMHRHRLTTAIALIALLSVSGFSSNPRSIKKQSIVSPSILLATQDGIEVAATTVDGESQTQTDEAPKAAVRCPDCDMCDGSGR